jgi:hypothetical protein
MTSTPMLRLSLLLASTSAACGTAVVLTASDAPAASDANVLATAAQSDAPPAVAPTPDPNTAAAPTPSVSCKRGLSYGGQVKQAFSVADLRAAAPGITWWYDWGAAPNNAAVAAAAPGLGIDFVPMLFNAGFDAAQVESVIPAGSKYLLGFNEPNFTAQGNLTPAQAAAAWPRVEAVAKAKGLRIVSPAVNYCGGGCNQTDPIKWLDAFLAACTDCQIDAIAIHAYVCYGGALTGAYLTPFAKYNKPIWLTEFACLDGSADATSEAVQERAMTDMVKALEADTRVERYAWFIGRSDSVSPPIGLLGADGELTALGKLYVSLPQTCKP